MARQIRPGARRAEEGLFGMAFFADGIDDVVTLVVPELQPRGRFRTAYEGATLRKNLGLPAAPSRWR